MSHQHNQDGRHIQIIEDSFMPYDGYNYLSASGAVKRRVFCKAAGLTGQELRLCKAKIKAVCGRKPVCPPVIGSGRCHKRKKDWENCARNLFVEYEKEVKAGLELEKEPVDTSAPQDETGTGLGNGTKGEFPQWAKYALIGGGILVVVVGGAMVIRAVSKPKVAPSVMAGGIR